MFSKAVLFFSLTLILFLHFILFNSQTTPQKKLVVAPPPAVQRISMHKVVLKKTQPKKVVKKVIKRKPKEIKKIVEHAKRKIIKKQPKIEKKLVKKEEPRIKPTVTKQLEKPKPNKMALSTAVKNRIENQYLNKIRQTIENNKIYPKKAKRLRQEGEVVLAFVIAKNGKITQLSIKEGSRFKRLNKAAYKLLKRISSFAPIPNELGKTTWAIEVPINYSIYNV